MAAVAGRALIDPQLWVERESKRGATRSAMFSVSCEGSEQPLLMEHKGVVYVRLDAKRCVR